ncbi:MAG: acetylxylan esterase [Campylobacterales bacterium]|nr:acetylxylan esterase [Campylobacterales bacterium]
MKQFVFMLFFISSLFAKEITLTSSDGFKLHAWLDKPANTKESAPIILFAHQFGADHTIWNDLAKKFNAKGYATLNVDLRGHGKSILQNGKENSVITDTRLDHIREALQQSNKKVSFENIPADLALWLEQLSDDDSIDMNRLYLFGSSLGGGSIIPLLSEYEAKGVVAISSGRLAELAEETDMALSMSMTKQLYIAAKDDPLEAAQRTLEYAKKSILGTAIIISGDGHGTVLLPQVEEYIFTFMKQIK